MRSLSPLLRGEGWGEGHISPETQSLSALQLRKYHRQHAILVAQYVGIPESQHMISLRGECRIAHAITWIIGVLPSIDFNDESLFSTHEIDHVGRDRFLPDELEPAEPSVTQCKPQLRFSIGGLAPKASFQAHFAAFGSTHGARLPPHPNPLPAKGGERERTESAVLSVNYSQAHDRTARNWRACVEAMSVGKLAGRGEFPASV